MNVDALRVERDNIVIKTFVTVKKEDEDRIMTVTLLL